MKIIAHSQVPTNYTYSHLGYVSAQAYNNFITKTIPRIVIGVLVFIAAVITIYKIRKRRK